MTYLRHYGPRIESYAPRWYRIPSLSFSLSLFFSLFLFISLSLSFSYIFSPSLSLFILVLSLSLFIIFLFLSLFLPLSFLFFFSRKERSFHDIQYAKRFFSYWKKENELSGKRVSYRFNWKLCLSFYNWFVGSYGGFSRFVSSYEYFQGS